MDHRQVLQKLKLLRSRDKALSFFGSSSHRYVLEPVASEQAVGAFEDSHRVKLPAEFREFVTLCGNGGAGPYYGIFPLGLFDGAGRGLEPWREGDGFAGVLSRPFPHDNAWNLPESRLEPPSDLSASEEDAWFEKLDSEQWAPELTNGAFPICHQGCAYRNLLVVSGPERGHVWLDARASDGGILPVTDTHGRRATFWSWYTDWLDAGLAGRRF